MKGPTPRVESNPEQQAFQVIIVEVISIDLQLNAEHHREPPGFERYGTGINMRVGSADRIPAETYQIGRELRWPIYHC